MEISIKRMNGDYSVQFKQGFQSFSLAGVDDKETAYFMKSMLETAFKAFIDEEIKLLNTWILVEEKPPKQHQLVIAKYTENTYAIARFENGSFLTAYPVYTQPIEYRPLYEE